MASELFEYCNTGDTGNLLIRGDLWRAQTFTPLEAHKITSVKLKIYRKSTPGTFVVGIRATDAEGHPIGEDLCSGEIDANLITTNSSGLWYEIGLGDGADLLAGTKYAIVARAPDGVPNKEVNWRYNSKDIYPRGNVQSSTDAGLSWTDQLDRDFMFEDWGEVGPPAPTIETQDATAIKSTEAMLHTKVLDDQGKTLSVRHNWGKTTAYGENTPWQEGKHTNDLISQKITGLDPETEHHFRGEAIFED